MGHLREYKVNEVRDSRGDHFIKITSPWNGQIIYSSHEGYKNKIDLIETSVLTAELILKKYAPEKLVDHD